MKLHKHFAAALAGVGIIIAVLIGILPSGAVEKNTSAANPGDLTIIKKDGKPGGSCPLKHTDVDAEISGFIARVNVVQEFTNPTKEKIEAVYTFPLPEDSAVDRMEMKVGTRTIVGEIHKREEAREIYEAAKEAGYVASLLDQERPNIFTQSVANILPGEKVVITISYTQLLKYQAGEYKFVFPMVVGPRYIPGQPAGKQGTGWSADTNQVPDASKITPPVTPKGTRTGHDISLKVQVNAGIPLLSVTCDTHDIDCQYPDETSAAVELRDKATIPNKDFVLRYNVAGEMIRNGVITHAPGGGGGYFTLIFQPPKTPKAEDITPKEMIFVIDTSGSQQGQPIEKSKETMFHCIKNVNPGDTFNLIAFSDKVKKLFESPQPYTQENLKAAEEFLKSVEGNGGTEMLPAVKEALEPEADPNRLRIVVFCTDGYIGNDFEILDCVKKNSGSARVFPFGIGSSVNRYLIEKMAEYGRGASEIVLLDSDSKSIAEKFYNRIRNPLLTDININWNGLPVVIEDLYPSQIGDLFSAQPLIVKGRYTGPASGNITVRGKVAGKPWVKQVPVEFPASRSDNDSLASIWARAKVDDLMDQDLMGAQNGSPKPEIRDQIVDVALNYHLMTQYTSFVAVETMVVTDGGAPKTIAVPVEMPEGVSYEGVFGTDKVRMRATGGMMLMASPSPAASTSAYNYAAVPQAGTASLNATVAARVEKKAPAKLNDAAPPKTDKKHAVLSVRDKLDKLILALVDKFKSGKSDQYSIPGKLVVKDGKVEVLVWVKGANAGKLAQLDKLGFANRTWVINDKVLIGWVPIGKLESAAKLEFVKRITAPSYVTKK